MKKKGILLTVVILLTAVIAGAETPASENKLSGTLDVTYVSRYIWRGFDLYPHNHSAIQPSIDLDLFGTGFGTNIWWSRANRSGFEDCEEFDFTLYYGNSLFENESYATEYEIGWVYYYYPDCPRKAADSQEAFASFSWPKLLPCGLVPSYTAACMWPSESHSEISDTGGWFHIFGLGYDIPMAGLLPDKQEQKLHLSAEIVYNDGAGSRCAESGEGSVDHDWSDVVFGVSTDFDLGNNLSFTPALYHQISMEDTVNTSDETWVSLSIKYSF